MLVKHPRRRMPLDGSWVRAMVPLRDLFYAAQEDAEAENRIALPTKLDKLRVPAWVRMVPHQGQETRSNPSGIYYHPIIKVQDNDEIECWSAYAANMERDGELDGFDAPNAWHYIPIDDTAPGEDTSRYSCSNCGEWLYRDDLGRRQFKSACIYDGSLVCRSCDVRGLVYAQDVADRIEECRNLADFIGAECRQKFERQVEFLSRTKSFGYPSQTRVWLDGKWSFYWMDQIFTPQGKKMAMNGGLIQHGPTPVIQEDGTYKFRRWDYGRSVERDATPEEVQHIEWSIHT